MESGSWGSNWRRGGWGVEMLRNIGSVSVSNYLMMAVMHEKEEEEEEVNGIVGNVVDSHSPKFLARSTR